MIDATPTPAHHKFRRPRQRLVVPKLERVTTTRCSDYPVSTVGLAARTVDLDQPRLPHSKEPAIPGFSRQISDLISQRMRTQNHTNIILNPFLSSGSIVLFVASHFVFKTYWRGPVTAAKVCPPWSHCSVVHMTPRSRFGLRGDLGPQVV